jgi:hypothetical protein
MSQYEERIDIIPDEQVVRPCETAICGSSLPIAGN